MAWFPRLRAGNLGCAGLEKGGEFVRTAQIWGAKWRGQGWDGF